MPHPGWFENNEKEGDNDRAVLNTVGRGSDGDALTVSAPFVWSADANAAAIDGADAAEGCCADANDNDADAVELLCSPAAEDEADGPSEGLANEAVAAADDNGEGSFFFVSFASSSCSSCSPEALSPKKWVTADCTVWLTHSPSK